MLLLAACGRLGFGPDEVDGDPSALSSPFGYPTVGASWGIFGSGIKAVNRFALAEAGTVSKLSIYVDGNGGPTGTGVMKGIIYADATGQPGALLATSNEISIASGAAEGWRDLAFASPVSLSAGNYFVGVLVGGTAYVIRETYDVQTGIMRYDADAYADGASNPYGTATTYDNKMSLYATYTTMPKTFGYPTVGASWGIFVGNGIKAVNRFSLPEADSVNKLSIYVDGNGGASGTGVMKGIIYADASGQPGALVATSSEVSIASGAAAGWRDLSFASPVSLSTGNYFIGVLVGGTSNVIRETYDLQTGIMRYDADAYADGASNPYGTATPYNNKMSIYATYGGGGGGGDTTPPVISTVGASSITTSAATITWTTNEASDSQVDYGTTASYGATTALDGSLVTSHSRALTGLAASTLYHYRVKSRDAAGNLAVSADATFTTSGAQLLFKSGFEGNVSLTAAYNISSNNAWQDVVGSDTFTGFSFASMVFGNKFTIQLLFGSGTLSNVIQNAIVSVTGHTGATTRALRLNLAQKTTQDSQTQFMINVTQSPQEFYVSEWLMYPPDLVQRLASTADGWVAGPPEWKSEGDFRIGYSANNWTGKLCWNVRWDTNANGGLPLQTFYDVTNCDIPVPVGQWFHVETYTRRGYGSDGRGWLKVNSQIVFDHTGTTIGQNTAPIDRLFLSGAYAGVPMQMLVDDFEIWDKAPY